MAFFKNHDFMKINYLIIFFYFFLTNILTQVKDPQISEKMILTEDPKFIELFDYDANLSVEQAACIYKKLGYHIVPIRRVDKVPLVSGWNDHDSNGKCKCIGNDFEFKEGMNIALHACNFICIDIDAHEKQNSVFDSGYSITTWINMLKQLGVEIEANELTPNKGLHYYFKKNPDVKSSKFPQHANQLGNWDSLQFELFAGGELVTCYPSIKPSGPYKIRDFIDKPTKLPHFPMQLLEIFLSSTSKANIDGTYTFNAEQIETTESKIEKDLGPRTTISNRDESYLLELLDIIPAPVWTSRDDWFKIACSIYTFYEGDMKKSLNTLDDYCKVKYAGYNSESYEENMMILQQIKTNHKNKNRPGISFLITIADADDLVKWKQKYFAIKDKYTNEQFYIKRSDPYVWVKFIEELSHNNKFDDVKYALRFIVPKLNQVLAFINKGECYVLQKVDTESNFLYETKMRKVAWPIFKIKKNYKNGESRYEKVNLLTFIQEHQKYFPQYANVIAIPHTAPSDQIPKYTYNVWEPYNTKIIDYESDYLNDMLAFIKEVWANNNDINYQYLLAWFYRVLCEPHRPTKTCIIATGAKGIGKGTLIEFIELCMNKSTFLNINNMQMITNNFNSHLLGRSLIVCDEARFERDNYSGAFEILKGLIAGFADTAIEKKGKDIEMHKLYCNFILAGNHPGKFKIEQNDRRYFCIEINDKYRPVNDKPHQIFADLRTKYFNEKGCNAFYTFLMQNANENLKLADFNLMEIPKTELKTEMIQASFSPTDTFIHELKEFLAHCNNHPYTCDMCDNKYYDFQKYLISFDKNTKNVDTKIKATEFYDLYKSYCSTNKIKITCNNTTAFGLKIRELIDKKREGSGTYYIFNTIKI